MFNHLRVREEIPPLPIIGVDEAGRGALAGPVVACAVFLKPTFNLNSDIGDSKGLSAKKRQAIIKKIGPDITYKIGIATHRLIDKQNIRLGTLVAMQKAVQRMPVKNAYVIVDGRDVPKTDYPTKAVIKADATVAEVMIASIIAKEARDHLMTKYHTIYNRYGFSKHKGYGTKEHYDQLCRYGICPIHRTSFNLNKQLLLFNDSTKGRLKKRPDV